MAGYGVEGVRIGLTVAAAIGCPALAALQTAARTRAGPPQNRKAPRPLSTTQRQKQHQSPGESRGSDAMYSSVLPSGFEPPFPP